MSIIIDSYDGMDISAYEALIEEVVNASLELERCPYESEISITVVNDKEIREINKTHRNKDKPTDVLSFPMIDFGKPGDFDWISEEDEGYFNPDSGEFLLGDIVISLERAKEQAVSYEHSIEREIGFLVAHSMLHLLGYDHMNEEDETIMRSKQKAILDKVGLTR